MSETITSPIVNFSPGSSSCPFYTFHLALQAYPGLRSRVRRSVSLSDLLMQPEVQRLATRCRAIDPGASDLGIARAARLVSNASAGSIATLGGWIALVWEVHRADDHRRRTLEAQFESLVRTGNPDLFLRALCGLVSRRTAEGRLPLRSACGAVMAWDRPVERRRIAILTAEEYAAATK